jgi:hypothetical protein
MYTNDCQKIFHMLICIYLLNIFWNCLSFVFWVALIAWWAPVLYFPSKSQILSTSIYFKNKVLFVSSIYLLTTTCITEPNPIFCTHKKWKVRQEFYDCLIMQVDITYQILWIFLQSLNRMYSETGYMRWIDNLGLWSRWECVLYIGLRITTTMILFF